MKVIICGAGQVGRGIAEYLAEEGNDITVIDTDPKLVDDLSNDLDINGIVGHGSHPDILQKAGARKCDMLIAVTYHDEINMVACQVARTIFDIPHKIARIRAQVYRDPEWNSLFSRTALPIDLKISPEKEVGDAVLRRIEYPGAIDAFPFDDGHVMALGINCSSDCPVLNTPLEQLSDLFPELFAMIVGIWRDGEMKIADKNDKLQAGDNVYLLVRRDQVERTLTIFGRKKDRSGRVIIAGAGNVGLYVAQKIEERFPLTKTRLIENNHQRSALAANVLGNRIIVNGSALDRKILMEADIRDADMMVALTNDDQVNMLSSVLGRKLGCRHNVCLLNDRSYRIIVDGLGIETHLNPRSVTISRILAHVRRGRIRKVYSIENGEAEFFEVEAISTSPLAGHQLQDLSLPAGVKIGALIRNETMILPGADTMIEADDRIILFVLSKSIHEAENLFKVALDYF